MLRRNGFILLAAAVAAMAQTVPISTFEELKKIGADPAYPLTGSYELTADIDASSGGGSEPIGRFAYQYGTVVDSTLAFSGTFDGKGFKISGLYINRSVTDNSGTGLFGYVLDAEIKNVALVGASVTGGSYVGALVGRTYGSTKIEGCYSIGGNVSGVSTVGGLVGYNDMGGTIAGCYSSGTVTGSGDIVGGLVGGNDYQIDDSYSTAAVSGVDRVGGFVGESYWNRMSTTGGGSRTIRRCYSAGTVSGTSSVGGFAGNNDNTSELQYCYWDILASGQSSGGTGVAEPRATGMTTAEMQTITFDAGENWGVSNSYPYLKNLPRDTVTFTAASRELVGLIWMKRVLNTAPGTVSGKSELVQIVNHGVSGVPVVAAIATDADGAQVGDSLAGWYLHLANWAEITDGDNGGFHAKLSGDTIALSGLTGYVEARFALKKYTAAYVSRVGTATLTGGKIKITATRSVTDDVDNLSFAQNYTETDSISVELDYGTIVEAEAIPDPTYRFKRWSTGADDTDAVRTDVVAGDRVIYATFELDNYDLKYTVPAEGRLYVDGAQRQALSYTVSNKKYGDVGPTIRAEPTSGNYEFVMWNDSVTTAERQDIVTGSIDVTAIFAPIRSVRYRVVDNGKLLVGGVETTDTTLELADGRIGPTVEAIPNTGYIFEAWSGVGNTDVTTPTRQDTISGTIHLVANFVRVYELRYTAGENGTLKVGGVETTDTTLILVTGTTGPTVEAVPFEDTEEYTYGFVKWSDDSTGAERQDIAGKDIHVTAEFAAEQVSILTPRRVAPPTQRGEEAVIIAPAVITAGELTAGPNPAARESGSISFFRTGRGLKAGTLTIYDAFGNAVRKIDVKDNSVANAAKRTVGAWDLKDSKGRPIAAGSYLAKGVLTTRNGDKEKVSIIISVR